MEEKELTRAEKLEFDIDRRMLNLWAEMNAVTEWNIEVVAAFMRAAYGLGYVDALTEDAQGIRAKLNLDNGYKPA